MQHHTHLQAVFLSRMRQSFLYLDRTLVSSFTDATVLPSLLALTYLSCRSTSLRTTQPLKDPLLRSYPHFHFSLIIALARRLLDSWKPPQFPGGGRFDILYPSWFLYRMHSSSRLDGRVSPFTDIHSFAKSARELLSTRDMRMEPTFD